MSAAVATSHFHLDNNSFARSSHLVNAWHCPPLCVLTYLHSAEVALYIIRRHMIICKSRA